MKNELKYQTKIHGKSSLGIQKLRQFVSGLNTDELVYLIYKDHLEKNKIYDSYDV